MNNSNLAVFLSLMALIFSSITSAFVVIKPIELNTLLAILSFLVGATALAVTVFTVTLAYRLTHERSQIEKLHDASKRKLDEIEAIESQQQQLIDAFLLTSRFANEMSYAVDGSPDDLNEAAARQTRTRLYPIRYFMQAVQLPDPNDRLDACRDAVGTLETLGEKADPSVCEFALRFFARLPVLAKSQGRPLDNRQFQRLEGMRAKIEAVSVASKQRKDSFKA